MPDSLSRRRFLSAAGGITFLALVPAGEGLFAGSNLPLFTALPYLQPGSGSRLIENEEAVVIAWQTESRPADFELEFRVGAVQPRKARIARLSRLSGRNTRFNYSATLDRLPLGTRVTYKVTANGRTVVEGYFTTRQPRDGRIRFVALGDNGCPSAANRHIAYQAYLQRPDFVLNSGDSVYDKGLDGEYSRYFFPIWNSTKAGPKSGAPLLRSVPYYSVLGNHDFRSAAGWTAASFDSDPGALAYFTNMYLPGNGPVLPVPPHRGPAARIAAFRRCAGERFPRMANYSFDYGPAHFTCLDSNLYVDPMNQQLQRWLEADLKQTDARWKFVIYHHAAFNVGTGHYAEQHMRALTPLLENNGVDVVLAGHEHVYQRSRPFKFQATSLAKVSKVGMANRRVPGKFDIDHNFDGKRETRPNGIIYITTGAGGQKLYDTGMNNNPAWWRRKGEGDYVARLVSDRHSLSVFEVEGNELTMRQVDEWGREVDSIRVRKA